MMHAAMKIAANVMAARTDAMRSMIVSFIVTSDLHSLYAVIQVISDCLDRVLKLLAGHR